MVDGYPIFGTYILFYSIYYNIYYEGETRRACGHVSAGPSITNGIPNVGQCSKIMFDFSCNRLARAQYI